MRKTNNVACGGGSLTCSTCSNACAEIAYQHKFDAEKNNI